MVPSDASPAQASLDPEEAARFAATAHHWWDPHGPFAALHRMNPARLDFALEQIAAHFGRDRQVSLPLAGISVLDAGCGGGLLTEPLARLGASVCGIDPVGPNLETARQHAEEAGLQIDYRTATAEILATGTGNYDVIFSMEVVEHLADLDAHLDACARLLRPGGLFIVSTLNRTMRSYLLAIVGAERILRWVPKGTHDWRRFLRPDELRRHLRTVGLEPVASAGITFDPLRGIWQLRERDLGINYVLAAIHPPTADGGTGGPGPDTSGSSASEPADSQR